MIRLLRLSLARLSHRVLKTTREDFLVKRVCEFPEALPSIALVRPVLSRSSPSSSSPFCSITLTPFSFDDAISPREPSRVCGKSYFDATLIGFESACGGIDVTLTTHMARARRLIVRVVRRNFDTTGRDSPMYSTSGDRRDTHAASEDSGDVLKSRIAVNLFFH